MEFLEDLTVRELINYIVGIIGVVSVFVEFSKKLPFKPWSLLFKWIGEQMTKDLNEKLVDLKNQQTANNEAIIELDKKVEKKFAEKQVEDDEKESKRLRASIISFSDSCRVGNHHTKNHFENVFRDIGDYENYIRKHNIPNHYIEEETRFIKCVYEECLRENKFL